MSNSSVDKTSQDSVNSNPSSTVETNSVGLIARGADIHRKVKDLNSGDTVGPWMNSVGDNLFAGGNLLTAASNNALNYGTGALTLSAGSYVFDIMRGRSATFATSVGDFMPKVEPKKAVLITLAALAGGLLCKFISRQLKDTDNQKAVRNALGREDVN